MIAGTYAHPPHLLYSVFLMPSGYHGGLTYGYPKGKKSAQMTTYRTHLDVTYTTQIGHRIEHMYEHIGQRPKPLVLKDFRRAKNPYIPRVFVIFVNLCKAS